jgi:hypothetical protein
MELSGSEVQVMQELNLKIRKRKLKSQLLTQRLKHHDIGCFALTSRGTNALVFSRNLQLAVARGIRLGVGVILVWAKVETSFPSLFNLFKPYLLEIGIPL